MLELVVSDDLTPPLQCPRCGWLYVRCSLPIPAEGAKCSSCGGAFRLPELASGQQGARQVPHGISVAEEGASWTLAASTRSWKGALGNLAGGLALLGITILIWMNGGWLFGRIQEDSDNELRELGMAVFAGSVILLGAAVWRFWGRYKVSVNGGAGTVFKGIGGIGNKRAFGLPVINGVCLTKAVSFDRRGNQIDRRVIRLEGVDFHLDFGEDLADEQRAHIALFLLQKRVEFKA